MRSRLQLAALAVALACVVFHAVVAYDPFPGWSDDPTRLPAAMSALGPGGSIAVDAILLIAASVLMVTSGTGPSASSTKSSCWYVALASIAATAALLRSRGAGVDDLALGLNWTAGLYASVAIALASRDATCRRISAAVLLGLIGLLVARAGVQFLIENPQAYADFKRSKPEILAAHGWSSDSPLAKSFERRVSQPDAGGWFGLSNVLGSVAAGCTIAFLGLTINTWRALKKADASTRDVGLLLLSCGLLASLATLTFSMSKGAVIAMLGGGAVFAFAQLRLKRPLFALLGIACILGPIALVITRGLVGERLHELSLLFRWFYMQGAARIITGPGGWNGVGPGGFQDAYMLAKPALSPENVSSPHNIPLDRLASFGVFGLAWVGVIVWNAIRAGSQLTPELTQVRVHEPAPTTSFRGEIRLAMAIAAIPTLLAALIEREMATEWSTAVRLVGLILFGVIASGILLAMRRAVVGVPAAIAAGALAVLLHAQIDMVGTTPGSSPWFWAFFALAGVAGARPTAAPSSSQPQAAEGASHSRTQLVAICTSLIAVLGALAWCTPRLLKVWEWESNLRQAALLVRPIPLANALMSDADPASRQDRWREAADVLGSALGRRVPIDPDAIAAAMREARVVLVDQAIPRLESACALQPIHAGTHRAASELLLTQSIVRQALGDAPHGEPLARRSRELMESFLKRQPQKSTAWAWLGLLDRTIAEQWKGARVADDTLPAAVDAYEHAATTDPHGVVNLPPLVDLLLSQHRPTDARRWAKEALDRNAMTRLDPLAGLPPDDLARLKAVAEGP